MRKWLGIILLLGCGVVAPGLAVAQSAVADWSASPSVAYPDTATDWHGQAATTYAIVVVAPLSGSFAKDKKYWLRFQGLPPLLACAKPPVAFGAPPNADDPCTVVLDVQNGGRQATFSRLPASLTGIQKLMLQADGDTTALGPIDVAFSLVSSFAVRGYAVLVIAVLVGIVLLLLGCAPGGVLTTGTSVGLLKMAFIDKETRTYSLSMLQFYVWGFAIISSYIYLTMARSLVQGAFEFAAVPANLPLLMGISVGTTAVSLGVSSMAGSKGSGGVEPTPADLITSGGVVAPERLLHLLWTILGGAAFVGFAFSIPPETINSLPAIPGGFLQLMGVSAAGYVGGKVARGPGPNIRSIAVTPPSGAAAGTVLDPLPLKIDGTNMATDGATWLMTQVDPPALIRDTPIQVTPADGSVIDAQRIATSITAGIAPVAPGLTFVVGNKYCLSIVNPDGEKASWNFVIN